VDVRPHHHDGVVRSALLLWGWAAAVRASELVVVDVADLSLSGDAHDGLDGGVLVAVRRSKTDTAAEGAHVAVPYALT